MKRKRPSVEIRKSDHPNKRRRITAMSILLPTELVRRISEFVVALTHAQFLGLHWNLRVGKLATVETINYEPYRGVIPNEYYNRDRKSYQMEYWPGRPRFFLRFVRFEAPRWPDYRRQWAIFKTFEDVGYFVIQIPINLISKVQVWQ